MQKPGIQHFWNWAPIPVSFHPYDTYHSWLSHHSSDYHKSTCSSCRPSLFLSIQIQETLVGSSNPIIIIFIFSLLLSFPVATPPIQKVIVSPLVFWNHLLTGLPISIIFSFPDANISQHVVYLNCKAGLEPLCLKVSLAYNNHYRWTSLHHQFLLDSYFMFGQNHKTKTYGFSHSGRFYIFLPFILLFWVYEVFTSTRVFM